MKRLIIVAALVCLMGVAMPKDGEAAGFEQHPNYSRINTLAGNIIQKLVAKQADFFLAYGKYFQGVTIPDYPVDGVNDVTVAWNKKPSDQEDTWLSFDGDTFKSTFRIPFQVSVSVTEGPSGWSWTIAFIVTYPGLGPDVLGNTGNVWIYQHHEGPEPVDLAFFDKWIVLPDAN